MPKNRKKIQISLFSTHFFQIFGKKIGKIIFVKQMYTFSYIFESLDEFKTSSTSMLKIYKNDIIVILTVLQYDKKEELIKSPPYYFLLYEVSRCKSCVPHPPDILQA